MLYILKQLFASVSVSSGGYLPRRSGSVNIHRYSPPLRRIIVKYTASMPHLHPEQIINLPSPHETNCSDRSLRFQGEDIPYNKGLCLVMCEYKIVAEICKCQPLKNIGTVHLARLRATYLPSSRLVRSRVWVRVRIIASRKGLGGDVARNQAWSPRIYCCCRPRTYPPLG